MRGNLPSGPRPPSSTSCSSTGRHLILRSNIVSWDPGRFGIFLRGVFKCGRRWMRDRLQVTHTRWFWECYLLIIVMMVLQRCSGGVCSKITLTFAAFYLWRVYNWRSWFARLNHVGGGPSHPQSWEVRAVKWRGQVVPNCYKCSYTCFQVLRSVSGTTDQSILAHSREGSRKCAVLCMSLCRTVRWRHSDVVLSLLQITPVLL